MKDTSSVGNPFSRVQVFVDGNINYRLKNQGNTLNSAVASTLLPNIVEWSFSYEYIFIEYRKEEQIQTDFSIIRFQSENYSLYTKPGIQEREMY